MFSAAGAANVTIVLAGRAGCHVRRAEASQSLFLSSKE
jgi:hypothetical protein